ncbi:tellurium resistance protein TerC [Chryseobacterium chendengshani]|uniref:MauE/DoxX family redox-associated membrane protein n=1 Tax=Chryseobacterium sp. LJ668 TaxID=2864040 RepID=UPI001C691340|nr:MauE/DoxX family redox-associated membrane protein [Chryseobacterium sp. LJ668]MBW8523819.1 tellurium resistance protein TerC [Chryseobacterium sp. LJ668]QYK16762.1 tellurium resistance protein TerC [Chryseobacterium sp. LJ668]
MKKLISHIPFSVSYFFVLLFCYAAISKMLDFENFQVQIGQSPMLSAYAGFVSYAVIVVEMIVVILLIIKKTQRIALYASTALMTAFTTYIIIILTYSDFVPCSCGGILEDLNWTEHLIFNIACIVIGIFAIYPTNAYTNYSKKSVTVCLFITNAISCLTVIILYISSENIIKEHNNFTRRFMMHPIIEHGKVKLDNKFYYFAGIDHDRVYLGNRKFPQQISIIDSAMNRLEKNTVELDVSKHLYRKIEIKVGNGYYYIYDGTVPIIKRGLLGKYLPSTISDNDAYFSELEIVNPDHLAIRTQSSTNKELIMGSIRLNSHSDKVSLYPKFLEKQTDGIFDSDGTLAVDRANSQILYTYSYRNQFIVADSGFQIQRRLRTIDTVATAAIKSVSLPGGIYKMKNKPLRVNGISTVYRGLLFNHSYLKGKYESDKRWKKSKVIDVYKTNSNRYIGSLYLENDGRDSVSDIIVTDHFLYAIRGKELLQYQLTQPILKYFEKGEAENLNKE